MITVVQLVQIVRRRYGNFPFFFVVGGSCTVLDLIIIYTLTDLIGLWYVTAGIISFIIVSVISFVLHKTISFDNPYTNYHQQYAKFLVVILIGMAINISMLYLVTHYLGIWYIFSRLLASAVAMIWNYTANSKLVFKI